jgi:peptide/nickel transport system permease protein
VIWTWGSRLAVACLGVVYLAALGATYLAPYSYAQQHRRYPLHPPTALHFFDSEGRFHLRPFVDGPVEGPGEGAGRRIPVSFFVRPEPDPFAGPERLPAWKLFGVEEPAVIFLLGTDELGRDVFSRLLHGARVSLFAGLLAGLLAVALGTAIGAIAGYAGGWVDEVLMRLVELALALPWLYLLLVVRAFLPLYLDPLQSFLLVVGAIACVGWAAPARLVRGVAMKTSHGGRVEAARAVGVSRLGILKRYVVPPALPMAVTQLALSIPQFILAEVTLSFLGLGVGEPVPSWGSMLAALQSFHVLTTAWWMVIPAFALAVVVLSYHQLAIVLQQRLNPTSV